MAVSLLWAATTHATLLETWESQPNANPFTGAGDLTWTGDVGEFEITTATWPSGTTADFAGSHSLRGLTSATAVNRTVLTSISSEFNLQAVTWSVYVGGNSMDISGGPADFSLILMSDSSSAAAVEAGTMNGYRIRIGDATGAGSNDSIFLEKANGTSWSVLREDSLGATTRNQNEGWNLLANRTAGGVFNWGFQNGTIGSPASFLYSFTDATILTASYAGMNSRGPSGSAQAFGFDNFQVVGVPEPSALALLGLGGLLAWRRRR